MAINSVKQIFGYKGYYIDMYGKVYSKWKQVGNHGKRVLEDVFKELKIIKRNTGYCGVTLCKDGKRFFPNNHRLVAKTFIPNSNNYPCVCHKDGDKENNNVKNLRWDTHRGNMQDKYKHNSFNSPSGDKHWNNKISRDDCNSIRRIYKGGGVTQKSLAKMFKVTQQHISDTINFRYPNR